MSYVFCLYPYPWASNPTLKSKDPYLFPCSLSRLLNFNRFLFIKGPFCFAKEWEDYNQLLVWFLTFLNIFFLIPQIVSFCFKKIDPPVFVFFHINFATAITIIITSILFPSSKKIIKCDLTPGELDRRLILRFKEIFANNIFVVESQAAFLYLSSVLSPNARIVKSLNGVTISSDVEHQLLRVDKKLLRARPSPSILFCSRLSVDRTSPAHQVALAEQLLSYSYNIIFIDYGEANIYRPSLLKLQEKYPNQLILKNSVNHDDLLKLMLDCNIYVSLSTSESSKILLIEALAMGLSIVCTPAGMSIDLSRIEPDFVHLIPYNAPIYSILSIIKSVSPLPRRPINFHKYSWLSLLRMSDLQSNL